MENHFIKYCRVCQTVISQCRCPSKDKKILWGVCWDCEEKETVSTNMKIRQHYYFNNPMND